jgi:hypothetical protein
MSASLEKDKSFFWGNTIEQLPLRQGQKENPAKGSNLRLTVVKR